MDDPELYEKAKAFVLRSHTTGVSLIQAWFKLSYALAKQLVERMEAEGVISALQPDGARIVFDPFTKKPMTHSAFDALPVHTLIGNENRLGSLMLCGINHGYSKQDERLDASGIDRSDAHKSFFSDKAVNDYRMRNRIVEWFRLWGYDLANTKETAGSFEKSIVQTNWLQTCTNNVEGINIRAACINDAQSFLTTCATLKPKLLFFFSKELLWAFTSQGLSKQVQGIFGSPLKGTQWLQAEVAEDGQLLKAFTVGFAEYENLKVVSLPHPTGSKGLSDKYIAAFKPQIKEMIDPWWMVHEKSVPC